MDEKDRWIDIMTEASILPVNKRLQGHAHADHFCCDVTPIRQETLGDYAIIAINIADLAYKHRPGDQTAHRARCIRTTCLFALWNVQTPDTDCRVESKQMECIAICDVAHCSRYGFGLRSYRPRENKAKGQHNSGSIASAGAN